MFICARCKREVTTSGLFCPFCGATAPQPGSDADPFVGQTIAEKYFIHQLLGRGGMGKVYKATHITLDRPVVLKVLDRSLLADPSIVQRFHREARAASRLNHPNSINIIDFGQAADGTLFIAMEYLPGRSLARVIAEEFPVEPARVVKIGSQVLAALTEAHSLGILHRDLKPENVMVESRRDEADFVKVLDFGIAKLNEPGETDGPRLTQAGMVCGTPGYMSPEQARGTELDARSDLYSVGVILYELVTGKLPFEADTPIALVSKVLAENPTPPSERRPDLTIPKDLETLIMRALSPDPAERPASAEDFRNDLHACAVPEARPARATPQHGTVLLDPKVAFGKKSPSSAGVPPAGRGATPTRPVGTRPATRSPGTRPAGTRPAGSPVRQAGPPRHEMDEMEESEELEVDVGPASESVFAKYRIPIIAGGGVGLLLLGAVLVWTLTRGDKPAAGAEATPPPPPTVVQALPPPTQVVEPPVVEPPPPPPPPTTTTTTPPPPTTAPGTANKPTPADEPRKARGPAIRVVRDTLHSLKTPPAASGDGILAIVATPWAVVSINGKNIGETPREVRLAEGTYRLRATHPSLGVSETYITIAAGKRKLWAATFSQQSQ